MHWWWWCTCVSEYWWGGWAISDYWRGRWAPLYSWWWWWLLKSATYGLSDTFRLNTCALIEHLNILRIPKQIHAGDDPSRNDSKQGRCYHVSFKLISCESDAFSKLILCKINASSKLISCNFPVLSFNLQKSIECLTSCFSKQCTDASSFHARMHGCTDCTDTWGKKLHWWWWWSHPTST